jgi:hypothetical protein
MEKFIISGHLTLKLPPPSPRLTSPHLTLRGPGGSIFHFRDEQAYPEAQVPVCVRMALPRQLPTASHNSFIILIASTFWRQWRPKNEVGKQERAKAVATDI